MRDHLVFLLRQEFCAVAYTTEIGDPVVPIIYNSCKNCRYDENHEIHGEIYFILNCYNTYFFKCKRKNIIANSIQLYFIKNYGDNAINLKFSYCDDTLILIIKFFF